VPVVHRGAYEFGGLNRNEDFVPQSHPTDGTPPAVSGGTDAGLQPLASA
jgi:hypothetical protein